MATSQQIVLCYSREDIELMTRIRDNLRRVGLQVWTDEGLDPGSDEWKAAIVKAVRSASAVLVLMSPAANDSDLVKRTVQLAQSSDVEILPLMIAGQVHQSLLPMLADKEYIDLRDDYDANMIQVVRLCYEFRQQKDLRTTAELQQVMDTEPEDEPEPSVTAPKIENSGVKISVSRRQSMDQSRTDASEPESRNMLPLMIGGGVIALIIVTVAVLFSLGLPPFGSRASVDGTPETTEQATAAADVVEATDTEVATATDEPDATDTDEPEPTATDEPEATATDAPPTATDEPEPTATNTDEPPTQTERPSATPRPTEVEPTDVPPSATPVPTEPEPTQAPPTSVPVAAEDANLEMLYNGDTLLLHNIGDSSLNLTGIQFILVGETDADSVLFIMEEWGLANNILQSDRCVQVWRTEFSRLPATDPPADVCGSRSAFRSTSSQFWIAEGDKTVFEVRQNGDVLVQCEAAVSDVNEIKTCLIDY